MPAYSEIDPRVTPGNPVVTGVETGVLTARGCKSAEYILYTMVLYTITIYQ